MVVALVAAAAVLVVIVSVTHPSSGPQRVTTGSAPSDPAATGLLLPQPSTTDPATSIPVISGPGPSEAVDRAVITIISAQLGAGWAVTNRATGGRLLFVGFSTPTGESLAVQILYQDVDVTPGDLLTGFTQSSYRTLADGTEIAEGTYGADVTVPSIAPSPNAAPGSHGNAGGQTATPSTPNALVAGYVGGAILSLVTMTAPGETQQVPMSTLNSIALALRQAT